MLLLFLKFILSPILIALAVLASRRWGHQVGGWITGLPLTSAPVSVFLAVEHGNQFAATAARGTMLGLASVAAFALVYAELAKRFQWQTALIGGLISYAGVAVLSTFVRQDLGTATCVAAGSLLLSIRALPNGVAKAQGPKAPAWDLPLRAVVATSIVLLLTGASSSLGPQLAGLLSPLPVFAIIMTVFAHIHGGSNAAVFVLRGVMLGTFSFVAFFFVLALGVAQWGWLAYVLALVSALAGTLPVRYFSTNRKARREIA
jgi:uncharacterized membrane protein (GlpM family)